MKTTCACLTAIVFSFVTHAYADVITVSGTQVFDSNLGRLDRVTVRINPPNAVTNVSGNHRHTYIPNSSPKIRVSGLPIGFLVDFDPITLSSSGAHIHGFNPDPFSFNGILFNLPSFATTTASGHTHRLDLPVAFVGANGELSFLDNDPIFSTFDGNRSHQINFPDVIGSSTSQSVLDRYRGLGGLSTAVDPPLVSSTSAGNHGHVIPAGTYRTSANQFIQIVNSVAVSPAGNHNHTLNINPFSATSTTFEYTPNLNTGAGIVNSNANDTVFEVNVQSGGQLNVGNNSTLNALSDVTVQANGNLDIATGSTLDASGQSVTISGNTNVNGTLTGDTIDINSTGVLTGSGIVDGDVNNSGSISPGNSPGTMVVAGNFTESGTYMFEINDFQGIAGSDPGWDLLDISGDYVINPGATFELLSLDGASAGLAASFDPFMSYSMLVATAGSISGLENFIIDTSGFSNGFGDQFFLSTDGTNMYLNYSAVPEPSTWALLTLAAIGFGGYRLTYRNESRKK